MLLEIIVHVFLILRCTNLFRDKEGDYEASEEAWRMTLGLPVKSKYIIPSAYRPLNETNKASKYYTLNEKMYNKDLLRKK